MLSRMQMRGLRHTPKLAQTLHQVRLFTRTRERRQKQRDQQRNNADHHQQFHQRKSARAKFPL
jgi:hypothetical protein